MKLLVGNKPFDVEIKHIHNRYFAKIDNKEIEIVPEFDKLNQLRAINIDDKRYELRITKTENNYTVSFLSKTLSVTHQDQNIETITKSSAQEVIINSPMSGLVIFINVNPNQIVNVGQSLVVLEAMKMQNDIQSPIKAKVLDVYVKVGQTVEKDDKLIKLAAVED
ncbi:MAG: acetyl-CoA carboxylase biotin carboxyl carrier protein subunit [candidate division WOR-3 bacterium]